MSFLSAIGLRPSDHEPGQLLDPKTAETYLAQVYEDRKDWRGERSTLTQLTDSGPIKGLERSY